MYQHSHNLSDFIPRQGLVSPLLNLAFWPAVTVSKAAYLATANAPATSTWSTSHSTSTPKESPPIWTLVISSVRLTS